MSEEQDKHPEFRFIMQELDGRRITYTLNTLFIIQTGKGKKGSYETRLTFTGDLTRAVGWYNAFNIGNGFKKRLIAPSLNRPLLARAWS